MWERLSLSVTLSVGVKRHQFAAAACFLIIQEATAGVRATRERLVWDGNIKTRGEVYNGGGGDRKDCYAGPRMWWSRNNEDVAVARLMSSMPAAAAAATVRRLACTRPLNWTAHNMPVGSYGRVSCRIQITRRQTTEHMSSPLPLRPTSPELFPPSLRRECRTWRESLKRWSSTSVSGDRKSAR